MNINIGLGARRKTILLVDSDAHSRAALRNALEDGAFTVGEATNSREAKRTMSRVKTDAVIFDIAQDHDVDIAQDAGGAMALDKPPFFYIMTTAGGGLIDALDLPKLGVSGVFLKPMNPAVIVQTLKYKFG